MKKGKCLSGEALQIDVKRREAKSKGEKERYKHLNAEFQRREARERAAKNVSKKTPTARLTSIMAKLNNELEQKKAEETKIKSKKEKK